MPPSLHKNMNIVQNDCRENSTKKVQRNVKIPLKIMICTSKKFSFITQSNPTVCFGCLNPTWLSQALQFKEAEKFLVREESFHRL